MGMTAYYNEVEPYAAQWLRNLIAAGHIAPGDVDERDIRDVRPSDLAGYTQCHFFAGIGVWSYALRLAGWPDDRPVWTGSCPCQPFSSAGRGGGFADERHLWPHWHHLIRECRPDVVFGEQVASKDGLGWLDLVQADMEGDRYALGAVPFPAASVGAPQGRHRIYFVADADSRQLDRITVVRGSFSDRAHAGRAESSGELGPRRAPCELAGSGGARPLHPDGLASVPDRERPADGLSERDGAPGELGDAGRARLSTRQRQAVLGAGRREEGRAAQQSGRSFWATADWIWCRDGKYRPVEPGSFPLAHGAPARVGRLRAYGNAIVAPAAQAFIESYLESEMLS
jgi:DNA (cytosine-5)-methyltransferase 1